MNPFIYIIIVNYNNYEDTIECINSLQEIEYDNFNIIIVDNNSINDSYKILRETFPQYEIIQTDNNLGFAGGNNVGIKRALQFNPDYILLLNNDTVVDKNFLHEMITSDLKNTDVAIVGAKVLNYYEPTTIDSIGGYIDYFKFITVNYNDENKIDISNDIDVDYMTGCVMLIKTNIFGEIGFLPEEYFMYYEDTDFCVKVKEHGYRILCSTNAIIYHKVSNATGGQDSPFSIKWNIRNRLIFMRKYKNKVSSFKYYMSILYFYITRIIRWIIYKFKNDNDRANAIIWGIKEGRNFNRIAEQNRR